MSRTKIASTPEWAALEAHRDKLRATHLRDLFADDPARGETFSLEVEDLYVDHGYWEDLELCTKRVLEHIGEDAELEGETDGEEPSVQDSNS